MPKKTRKPGKTEMGDVKARSDGCSQHNVTYVPSVAILLNAALPGHWFPDPNFPEADWIR